PMHPLSRSHSALNKERISCSYRPRLDCLEDRLPLGDTLGWLVVCPAWGLTLANEPGILQLEGRTEDRVLVEDLRFSSNQGPVPTGPKPQTQPTLETGPGEQAPSVVVPEADAFA